MDSGEDVLGGRVHGLTAADHIIYTQVGEQLFDAIPRSHRYKAVLLLRVYCLVWECRFAFCFQVHQLIVVAVLLLHVVDLHIGQIAQLERRLNGVARLIGMYMTLDDLLIVHYNDTVADGFQISAQSQWVCVRVLFIDDELGAVAEMDVLFVKFCCHAVCLLFLRSCLLFLHGGNNLAALDDRQHTLPDLYKALSARIDYTGFFEHRQHLRCLCQSVLRTDQDFFPHLYFHISPRFYYIFS